MASPSSAVSQDTLITIKISVNGQLKKLKLPLRELSPAALAPRLRQALDIAPERTVVLERFSDSAGGYITLDEKIPDVFKTLIRAAKAKGKLRLKATVAPKAMPHEEEAPVEAKKVAVKATDPLISLQPRLRDSASAADKRNLGSGIFQFREARASQQTLVDEAPVPRPYATDRSTFLGNLAAPPSQPALPLRPREPRGKVELLVDRTHEWSLFCNECNKALPDAHYHCDICDDSDYDLCEPCVAKGKLCPGEGHWLIKRFLEDGHFTRSTTERISPRKFQQASSYFHPDPEVEEKTPGTLTDENKTLNMEHLLPLRTCNSCVIVLPEREFVTCKSCKDFDLCIKCHIAENHGHHPAHGFEPATHDTVLPLAAQTKLAPGRNVRHDAICDGCDKKIYGVRHKCLDCPDFDYCNDCVGNARHSHPRHRFAALYTPIPNQGPSMVRHLGIYCDGPLCSSKANSSHIQGVRYKCTICHETDFCANCEALPGNHHNRTHPLIKLKTPVLNVTVSTENEDLRGKVRVMGDRATPSAATVANDHINTATPVQTVAEIKPTEVKKDILPVQIPVKKFEAFPSAPKPQVGSQSADVPMTLMNAHFVHDSIADGMVVEPEAQITQIWILENPGPYTWPAGCSVRYVGGDNMLNVDNSHPASVAAINEATGTNVVGREVQVGEQVAFKVTLKAPVREGRAISYWRLRAADGTSFGHRLWCDIEVKKAEQRAVKPEQAPVHTMRCNAMNIPYPPASHHSTQQALRTVQHQMPSQQPPVYEAMHLSSRVAAMLEQQKGRSEQMIAQLNAQRAQLTSQATKREDMQSWAQTVPKGAGSKGFESMSDQERHEALRQRVAYLSADIIKTCKEREKLANDFRKPKTAAAEKKADEGSEEVKKITEEVDKQDSVEADQRAAEELERSQMVFPKLEKESPASSTYQSATSSSSKGKAAYVENAEGEVERSATPCPAPAPFAPTEPAVEHDDFVDLDDELEVLSAADDSEDGGFLTDEEYDVLDASDSETVASKY